MEVRPSQQNSQPSRVQNNTPYRGDTPSRVQQRTYTPSIPRMEVNPPRQNSQPSRVQNNTPYRGETPSRVQQRTSTPTSNQPTRSRVQNNQ